MEKFITMYSRFTGISLLDILTQLNSEQLTVCGIIEQMMTADSQGELPYPNSSTVVSAMRAKYTSGQIDITKVLLMLHRLVYNPVGSLRCSAPPLTVQKVVTMEVTLTGNSDTIEKDIQAWVKAKNALPVVANSTTLSAFKITKNK